MLSPCQRHPFGLYALLRGNRKGYPTCSLPSGLFNKRWCSKGTPWEQIFEFTKFSSKLLALEGKLRDMSAKRTKYLKKYKEIDAPGLDAINERELEIYGNQEATHIATPIPYEMGGKDPLWAVEYFKSKEKATHFHYVTLGYTNLFYDPECADDKVNGFGFEITFRHLPIASDPEKPLWAAAFLQNIAKYVWKYQNGFDEYHYMSAGGPFRPKTESDITAFVFAIDSELEELDTPHGHLKFLQLFGITTQEYQDIEDKKYTAKELVEKHKKTNPLLITDLFRKG